MDTLEFTDTQLLAALKTFETGSQLWGLVSVRAMELELRERRKDA